MMKSEEGGFDASGTEAARAIRVNEHGEHYTWRVRIIAGAALLTEASERSAESTASMMKRAM